MPRKKPKREITAYPRDYDFDYPEKESYGPPQMAYAIERAGWCMKCKDRPCVCLRETGSLFDQD